MDNKNDNPRFVITDDDGNEVLSGIVNPFEGYTLAETTYIGNCLQVEGHMKIIDALVTLLGKPFQSVDSDKPLNELIISLQESPSADDFTEAFRMLMCTAKFFHMQSKRVLEEVQPNSSLLKFENVDDLLNHLQNHPQVKIFR